jgi:ferritin-like metal-binding protein YciE
MPAIMNLQDLLVNQLRDVYSAEKQLVTALPKMAKATTSDELKEAITSHLQQTQEHVSRLEQIFEQLGVSSRGPKCKGMEGLLEEGKEMLDEDIDPNVLDAGIIASAQRVEHYEIAVYGTVVEFARALGHSAVADLLQSTLDEEKEANDTLTGLAEGGINMLAEHQSDAEEDESESDDAMSDDDDAVAPRAASSRNASSRTASSRSTDSKSGPAAEKRKATTRRH